MKHRDPILHEIHAIYGLPAQIARELEITRAAVCSWKKIPLKHLRQVARITGIDKERLRPDIFADDEAAAQA